MKTPFTAEEIRDGCPPGRTVVVRSVSADGTVAVETTRFRATDAEGAEISWTSTTEDGVVTAAASSRATWDDLRRHAVFPAERTTLSTETVETPLGRSICSHYRVEAPDSISEFWFANDRPGMPIRTRRTGLDGSVATTEVVSDAIT